MHAEWVRTHPEEDKGLWMLKNNKQRGTGLRLVRTSDAFAACFETTKRPGLEGVMLYRYKQSSFPRMAADVLTVHECIFLCSLTPWSPPPKWLTQLLGSQSHSAFSALPQHTLHHILT